MMQRNTNKGAKQKVQGNTLAQMNANLGDLNPKTMI
jgi:hypothetical protein